MLRAGSPLLPVPMGLGRAMRSVNESPRPGIKTPKHSQSNTQGSSFTVATSADAGVTCELTPSGGLRNAGYPHLSSGSGSGTGARGGGTRPAGASPTSAAGVRAAGSAAQDVRKVELQPHRCGGLERPAVHGRPTAVAGRAARVGFSAPPNRLGRFFN